MSQPRAARPRLLTLSYLLALLVLITSALGCGQQELKMTKTERVSALAGNLSDAAGNPEAFKSFFVDGAAPDDPQQYKGHGYRAPDPKISGDSATMTVTVTDAATGDVLGEMEWTAEKVGEQWKLKTAPLPDGA